MMQAGIKGFLGQSWILFRHFFSRMLAVDLLKFENQRLESRVVLLVILAVAGLLAGSVAYEPFLLFGMTGLVPADLWMYESLMVTFSMALVGVIAVASWDRLFLDRRDHANLLPLPVTAGTLFAGKALGLMAFVATVTLAGNFFPVLMATAYTSDILDSIAAGPAHFTAVLLAGIFVFLAVTLLRLLFTALLPPLLARRAGIAVQMLLLLLFLSPFVWFPMLFRSLHDLKMQGSPLFTFFPPLWFTGIFDRLIGQRDPLLGKSAGIGLAAVVLLLAGFPFLARAGLIRFMRAAGGPQAGGRRSRRPFRGLRSWRAFFLRHPIERAVFSFFMLTLRRSREPMLKLTLLLALPVSYLLSRFAFLYLKGGLAGKAFTTWLLSLPLILSFFLIVGIRLIVVTPHLLPASFIFRVSERSPLRPYVSGVRKAVFCSAILPPLLVCLWLSLCFWPWRAAALHALFCLAVALPLQEACFFAFRRIPFAAEHEPGKMNLHFYWPLLLAGGYAYHSIWTWCGSRLMRTPGKYPTFFLLTALVYALLRIEQRQRLARESLVFEEEPEPAMMTLGLD